MGERRDVNIKTSAFELTIHWNPAVMGGQACILIGLGAIALFAGKGGVRVGCIVGIIIDIVTMFIGLLGSSHAFDAESAGQEASTNSDSGSGEPVNVNIERQDSHKSSVKTSNKTIRNKVKMPTGVTPRATASTQQQPETQTQPQPQQQQEVSSTSTDSVDSEDNIVSIDIDELDADIFDMF